MQEIWKDIKGYENIYQISNLGNVKKMAKGKEKYLKPASNGNYFFVYLTSNKIKKMYFLHRLIAQAFIPNNDNKPCVNHKNGIKIDNRIENLEWCTYQENSIHSWKNGLQKKTETVKRMISRPVVCIETGKEFYGGQDAMDKTGIDRGNINKCCLKQRKTAGGYHWKYKESA